MKGDKVTLVQYRTLRSVEAEEGATYGATLGLNLYRTPGVLLKLSDFASTPTGDSGIGTTDDLDEGQYHFYFTDLRAQHAVGSILENTSTITLTYNETDHTIKAELVELADTGTGAALVKITRDAYGRVEGTEEATAADLPYDNTTSGLPGTNVQDAIDEIAVIAGGVPFLIPDGQKYTIPANTQALWTLPIELVGSASIDADGALVEVV